MQEVGGSIPPGSTNLRRFAASVGELEMEMGRPSGGFRFLARVE
jgi:hypothetical protein